MITWKQQILSKHRTRDGAWHTLLKCLNTEWPGYSGREMVDRRHMLLRWFIRKWPSCRSSMGDTHYWEKVLETLHTCVYYGSSHSPPQFPCILLVTIYMQLILSSTHLALNSLVTVYGRNICITHPGSEYRIWISALASSGCQQGVYSWRR